MSELAPYEGHPSSNEKRALPLPKHPEELYEYFAEREESQHEGYLGYADLAYEAAAAIAEAVRYGKTDEEKSNDIALAPGRESGIHAEEHTDASRELLELIIISHRLVPVADETSEYRPYGRILWQNSEGGAGINLVEHRIPDDDGDLVKITAISHVPEDLFANSHFTEELHASSRFRKETLAGIETIPVIEIDEEALVTQYFRKAA